MRLFVALRLPPGVAGELDRELAPLRPGWPALRWAGTDAWHLTLAFLGEVDEASVPKLAARLRRAAARHPHLGLAVAGAGAFPGAARARVLWAGVRGDRPGLARLAASAAAGARRAGVAGAGDERRRYQPHLTLARCREPLDVTPLTRRLDGFAGRPWVADEVCLIRSHLGSRPRYETLGAWPLRSLAS